MTKKILLISMLVLMVSFSLGAVLYADSGSNQPVLTLTVQQSRVITNPPTMIFTATLTNVPLPIQSGTNIMVNFYNGPANAMPPTVLIGSVPLNLQTGTAVLSKQINPGSWEALATTVIAGNAITSNTVNYYVP